MRKRMLKKIIFLLLMTTPAMAQSQCAQFGGFYIGGNVGWGHNDYQFDDLEGLGNIVDEGLPSNARTEEDGVVGGVQIGFNWQPCCSLLGIEADWNATSHDHSVLTLDGDQPGATDTLEVRNRVHWFGTVRGRAGVVVDRLLLFATAGFAYADTRQTWTFSNDAPPVSEEIRSNRIRYGAVGGVGAEWAINCCLSVKAEFLYIKFADHRRSFTSAVHNPGITYNFQSHESISVARVGVNYRWGC
jgi:outer membrane immunogenic protein